MAVIAVLSYNYYYYLDVIWQIQQKFIECYIILPAAPIKLYTTTD